MLKINKYLIKKKKEKKNPDQLCGNNCNSMIQLFFFLSVYESV